MRSRLLALAAAISLLAGAPTAMAASLAPAHAAAPSASRPCGTLASPHRYTHVIWVWMENHSYNTIIGSPQARYINSLAARCGLATNYHNITHPSLPNYVAATSGLGFPPLQTFTPTAIRRPSAAPRPPASSASASHGRRTRSRCRGPATG